MTEQPQPFIYTEMAQVPEPWRQLRGYRLTLEQVNWIMQRAHALGYEQTGEGHDPIFVPDLGTARQELLDASTPENGLLVPKDGDA